DGIRDRNVTGVQTCALPIYKLGNLRADRWWSTRSPASRLPGPEGPEALPMPANRRFGANYVERITPPCPLVGEPLPRGGDRGARSEERRVGQECRESGGAAL